VLVAVGVKLLFEDFPNGRPVTLFMALALVGGALILVSKLLPRRSPGNQKSGIKSEKSEIETSEDNRGRTAVS
jgi:hypothetical protein